MEVEISIYYTSSEPKKSTVVARVKQNTTRKIEDVFLVLARVL